MPRFSLSALLAVALLAILPITLAAVTDQKSIDSRIVRIATGDADSKPGILIVGAVDARKQYAKTLADLVAVQLQDAAKSDPKLLDAVTYYVFSQPSPVAASRETAHPLDEIATDLTPADDDRDGAIDEDGPEDLNGDGLITLMRVATPAGHYIAHPLDPRVMIEAKPENGEAGQYELYIEGVDSDHDEQWNEDPIGGVDFNLNFPFEYPYFQPGAGAFACCAVESKAVADWLWDHHNIVAVITLGGDDNLHNIWPSGQHDGQIVTSPPNADQTYFAKVAEKYKELVPREGSPQPTDQRGSLLKWTYLQYGRWAFGVDPWWPLEPKKEVVEIKDGGKAAEAASQPDGEAGKPQAPDEPVSTGGTEEKPAEVEKAKEGKETKAKWDEKDKRGEYELGVLKWMDATGVDGFVAWQAVTDIKDFPGHSVEVGGFKPYAIKPTAAELDNLAGQHTRFALAVAAMLPRIQLVDVSTESLGEGVYRITAKLVNSGALPTVSEMGATTRVPYPLQMTIELPAGGVLVTGRQRERLPRLLGGGGNIERSWVVSVAGGGSIVIKAGSPSVGAASATVAVK